MYGARIMAWAQRWLRPDDVTRVVAPAVADWRHEADAAAPEARAAVVRRGRRAVLAAIVHALWAERVALARRSAWWLLAFPLLAVATGLFVGATGAAQAAFFGIGALVFGLVATTPARWLSPTWAWVGVGALALTLVVGDSVEGATRWVGLGPLRVQVTLLVLPLVAIGGWRPAAVAAGLLAAAPDAVAGTALAIAVPHPITALATVVVWLREPAMASAPLAPTIALASALLVPLAAWRFRALPEGRLVSAMIVLGAGAHLAGHAPMPLVGYGGSAIVAVCLAFALAVSRGRSWTDGAALG